jgi:hypothetical protein
MLHHSSPHFSQYMKSMKHPELRNSQARVDGPVPAGAAPPSGLHANGAALRHGEGGRDILHSIRCLCWNVDRISRDMCDAFVQDAKQYGVVMLQERGAINAEVTQRCFTFIGCAAHDRTPCILIHRAVATSIVETDATPHYASCLLRTSNGYVIFMSLYLPDTSKGYDAFVEVLGNADLAIRKHSARAGRACRLVVGGDFNTKLVSNATPEHPYGVAVIGPKSNGCITDIHACRQHELVAWSACWDLEWASTFSLDSN